MSTAFKINPDSITSALLEWADLMGIDIDDDHKGRRRVTFGQLNTEQLIKDVAEAHKLDPTGLTCFMLLRACVERFIKDETVSARDVIFGLSDELSERFGRMRRLHEALSAQDDLDEKQHFIDTMTEATSFYGFDAESVRGWLASDYWMSVLRRDSFKSFESLERHQFMWSPNVGTSKPKLGLDVLEFWNIPCLVNWMAAQGRAGMRAIHVCLIRDPDALLNSFFVIAVINGETLSIMTDVERGPHPDYKHATRKPGRDFERRRRKRWFPYHLMDLDNMDLWGATPGAAEAQRSTGTGLTVLNAGFVRHAPISQLDPGCILWLIQTILTQRGAVGVFGGPPVFRPPRGFETA